MYGLPRAAPLPYHHFRYVPHNQRLTAVTGMAGACTLVWVVTVWVVIRSIFCSIEEGAQGR